MNFGKQNIFFVTQSFPVEGSTRLKDVIVDRIEEIPLAKPFYDYTQHRKQCLKTLPIAFFHNLLQ